MEEQYAHKVCCYLLEAAAGELDRMPKETRQDVQDAIASLRGGGSRGLERSQNRAERALEYTVVGVMEDGAILNQVVREVRDLGVGPDDLTVILKRKNPDEPEPFPDETRYIVIPDDSRGLEVPLGFAIVFVLVGLLFAATTPSIGIPSFLVFVSLAAVLVASAFTRVGISPILTDMEAPREESGSWNDEFELGRVLLFAIVRDRSTILSLRTIMQRNNAAYYIVDRRLEPRAVHQAVLHRAGDHERRPTRRTEPGTRSAQGA